MIPKKSQERDAITEYFVVKANDKYLNSLETKFPLN